MIRDGKPVRDVVKVGHESNGPAKQRDRQALLRRGSNLDPVGVVQLVRGAQQARPEDFLDLSDLAPVSGRDVVACAGSNRWRALMRMSSTERLSSA
jgi:hypothetical protein